MMPQGAEREQGPESIRPANPHPAPSARGSFTLGFLAVLASLVGAGLLGVNWFLSSRLAAGRLESQLAEVLGTTVRVETASIGWTEETRMTGLAVYQAHASAQDKPWLTVRAARINVAALDWLTGRSSPGRVDLEAAAIELDFDAEGKLRTRVPWPRGAGSALKLVLTNSRLILTQEGREPLALSGLQGEIEGADGALVLTAEVDDPDRGKWHVTGRLQTESRETELRLRTDRTVVTRKRLEALPFVSPSVWRHVRIDAGQTTVDLNLRFWLDCPHPRYRLDLHPSDVRLHVSSIDLDSTETSGRVRIEDGLVELDEVRGKTAGGRIGTSGRLDFREPNSRMNFQIETKQVQFRELPAAWKLLAQVTGRLTGQAQLQVAVEKDRVLTTGDGQGIIEMATFYGLPFPGSLPMRLHADGQKFHFGLQ